MREEHAKAMREMQIKLDAAEKRLEDARTREEELEEEKALQSTSVLIKADELARTKTEQEKLEEKINQLAEDILKGVLFDKSHSFPS